MGGRFVALQHHWGILQIRDFLGREAHDGAAGSQPRRQPAALQVAGVGSSTGHLRRQRQQTHCHCHCHRKEVEEDGHLGGACTQAKCGRTVVTFFIWVICYVGFLVSFSLFSPFCCCCCFPFGLLHCVTSFGQGLQPAALELSGTLYTSLELSRTLASLNSRTRSVELLNARALELSNSRTLELSNARTLELSNSRTLELSNSRTLKNSRELSPL